MKKLGLTLLKLEPEKTGYRYSGWITPDVFGNGSPPLKREGKVRVKTG
jgi:hypothetical protein